MRIHLSVHVCSPTDYYTHTHSNNVSLLTEKMTSGDIIQVAEVVRDLTHAQINKGISPALKRMLAKARMTLASEVACALGVDEEAAVEKINQYLPEEDPDDGL